ncbi:hypothetical protein CCP4SC76_900002 [Gammaproteobacteria bacterium]
MENTASTSERRKNIVIPHEEFEMMLECAAERGATAAMHYSGPCIQDSSLSWFKHEEMKR